ncbi:hypothetical protein D3C85_1843420 [compost metagenome]
MEAAVKSSSERGNCAASSATSLILRGFDTTSSGVAVFFCSASGFSVMILYAANRRSARLPFEGSF